MVHKIRLGTGHDHSCLVTKGQVKVTAKEYSDCFSKMLYTLLLIINHCTEWRTLCGKAAFTLFAVVYSGRVTNYAVCPKKRATFFNKSVKNTPIRTIFGKQNPEEILHKCV